MEMFFTLLAGFLLGCLHAFDADHLAAVAAFVGKESSRRTAGILGIRWGVGHMTTLVVLCALSFLFKMTYPVSVRSFAELLVGCMLIAIGTWSVRDLFYRQKVHLHRHFHNGVEHIHFHSHKESHSHIHRHSVVLMGATHGFAGSASTMVIIPVTLMVSVTTAMMYILVFGIGTMLAMGFFSYLAGIVHHSTKKTLPWFQGVSAVASMCVGIFWIIRIVWP